MSISIDLSGDVAGSGSGEVIARTLARAGAAVAGGFTMVWARSRFTADLRKVRHALDDLG